MINIKEELKTVEKDLKAEGKDVNKYNLIKKLCDYILYFSLFITFYIFQFIC